MRFLRSFARFWYDFVIGDDWKVAVAVVLALAVVLVAMTLGVLGDAGLAVLGGLAVVVAFTVSLAVDMRSKRSP